jgi:hypothetical protein
MTLAQTPATNSGQRRLAIAKVTGPVDIRRYNFFLVPFFCGKGFFFLHDIP